MNPHSDTRRSFVKKTLATTVTYSFAGLIKANGAPNGTTTHSTTVGTSTTTSPWETTGGITYATTAPWETTANTSETTILTNSTTVVTTEIKKEVEWRIILTGHPTSTSGTLKTYDKSIIDYNDSTMNNKVGELEFEVVAVVYPDDSKLVTSAELVGGIPTSKLFEEVSFQQKAKLFIDTSKWSWLHLNDSQLPSASENDGWALTPNVVEKLQYYTKSITWMEGESMPPMPASPQFADTPDADSAKSIAPCSAHLGICGEWSTFGWTWVGILKDGSSVTLDITHIGQWTPQPQEAKTRTIALTWGLQKATRTRTLRKAPNENTWTSVTDSSTDNEGWTAWMPE